MKILKQIRKKTKKKKKKTETKHEKIKPVDRRKAVFFWNFNF